MGSHIVSGIRIFVLVLIGVLGVRSAYSSHVMGAEIKWENIGEDSFKISVIGYSDCNSINLGNTPITLKSSCGNRTMVTSVSLIDDITPICKSGCSRCSSGSCTFNFGVRAYEITGIFYAGDWRKKGCCNVNVSWQQSNRNSAISTGGSGGMLFTNARMNVCLNGQNNSPKWSAAPISIICLGRDFEYNQGAVDADVDSNGVFLDSLVFSLDSPLRSATSGTHWAPGYSFDKPLHFLGFPKLLPLPRGFHLDQETGNLAFRPMKEEVTLIVIRCDIFRNGVNIGFLKRELQLAVIRCPNNIAPALSGVNCAKVKGYQNTIEVSGCVGDSIEFSICTSDPDIDDNVSLECISDLPAGAKFTITNPNSSRPIGKIKWKLDSLDLLNSPRVFTFRAADDFCPIIKQRTRNFKFVIRPGNTIPAKFSHRLVDTACGKYVLSGGKLGTLPIENQYWYVNDTLVGNGDSVIHTPSSTDSQFVKILMVRDGCHHVFYDTLVPDAFTPIRITPILGRALCLTENLEIRDTIKVLRGQSPYTYSWDIDFGENLKKTTDSIIRFKPKFNYTKKSVLTFKVVDSLGCEAKRRVAFDVTEGISLDLVRDTLICTNDSFRLPLKSYKDSLGMWKGGGVINNVFVSSALPDGIYRLSYDAYMGDQCVVDTTEIRFGAPSKITVDSLIETCANHVDISLNAQPAGGVWYEERRGTSVIVNDTLFRSINKTVYKLNYIYKTFVGCVDTAVTIVDATAKKFDLSVAPDTLLCANDPDVKFRFNANNAVWASGSTGKRAVSLGGSWYSEKSQMNLGENKMEFTALSQDYCRSTNSVIINYAKPPNVSFASTSEVMCVDDQAFELKFSPSTAGISGSSIIEKQGKHYVVPSAKNIGTHQYMAELKGSSGCVGRDSFTLVIKDTVKRGYTLDTILCHLDTIPLKSLTALGAWTGTVNAFQSKDKEWYAVLQTPKVGEQYLIYETQIDSACFYFDTSFFRIRSAPKPMITKGYEACVNHSDLKLDALEKDVVWYGGNVARITGDFYFQPRLATVGKTNIYAFKKDSFGCRGYDTAIVKLFDIPQKPLAGNNDQVCMGQKVDSTRYWLKNSVGTWSGKGLNSGGRIVTFHKDFPQRTYPYVLTITDDHCSNFDTVLVSLGRNVSPAYTLDKDSGEAPLQVTFTDETLGSVYREWYFGTGDSAINTMNPTYTYLNEGKYDVLLFVHDSMKFCSKTLRKNELVTVLRNSSISEYNNSIKVFPNAVKDVLTVNSESVHRDVSYRVYDLKGSVVLSGQLDLLTQTQINVSDLQSNAYLLELSISDAEVRTLSFIKE